VNPLQMILAIANADRTEVENR